MRLPTEANLPWYLTFRNILLLYSVLLIVATIQAWLLPLECNPIAGQYYTHYNNYIIFKQSFFHLIHHQDLYTAYHTEHWDYYKYTPTFSVLFAPLALLPDLAGLFLWNVLNMIPLVIAVFLLPVVSAPKKGAILLLGCVEAMTSIQSEQSNGLLAALFILAFALCERRQYFWAIGCLALATFIKPFALPFFALFLFYPNKLKHILYGLLWSLLLGLLPLLFISPAALIAQYESWLHLLSWDHALKYGYSVLGWFHTWFQFHPDKNWVTGVGIILLLIPFLRWQLYQHPVFRILSLASAMIWVVIFNHMAESPTFVIAMMGASIWFFARQRGLADLILFIVVICFISLSTTDLIPREIRREIFRPYLLKAVPCIFLWIRIFIEMMRMQSLQDTEHVDFKTKPLSAR